MSLSPDRPSSFARAMNGYYDREWLEWTPEATEHVLRGAFDQDPSPKDLDKVEASISLIRENRGVQSPLLFEKIVILFNDKPVSFDVWQGASPDQIVVGLYKISEVMGEEDMKSTMSEPVRAYIGGALVNDDVHAAPEALRLDVAEAKVRAASGVDENVRSRIISRFEKVISGEEVEIESRLRRVAAEMKGREEVSSTEGGNQARQESAFIRRQVGRLTVLAMRLREKGSLA